MARRWLPYRPKNIIIFVVVIYTVLQVFVLQGSLQDKQIQEDERILFLERTVRYNLSYNETVTAAKNLTHREYKNWDHIRSALAVPKQNKTHGVAVKNATDRPVTKKPEIKVPKEEKRTPVVEHRDLTPYHAIVNSYMRSGSSFVGRLLGFHPDSFYFYEPLNKYLLWEYFHGKQLCQSNTCNCRQNPSEIKTAADMKMLIFFRSGGGDPQSYARHLANINKCAGFRDLVYPDTTDFYSGPLWEDFTKCSKKYGRPNMFRAPDSCLFNIQMVCSKYKHVVSKVLRLTLDNYMNFLVQTNDAKVIHLFRDPRAILNSRITTPWFPVNSTKDVRQNAMCLCRRMLHDYNAGMALKEKFPDKFIFLLYEDLVDNLREKTNKLYDFVGLRHIEEIGEEKFKDISTFGLKTDHALRDNSSDTTSWWRHSMSWKHVQEIDRACAHVYKLIGYIRFQNEQQLRDTSQPYIEKPYKFSL